MSSKTETREKRQTISARNGSDLLAAASRRSSIFTQHVGELEAKPQQQSHMSLGIYGTDKLAKGFSIEFGADDSESPESVVTQITSAGTPKRYELTLHIANHSAKTVHADIWQM